jgi:hypothetical protein
METRAVASMRMTKLVRRELVPRLLSKKMPPRKGRKKRSMMAAEKPSAYIGQGQMFAEQHCAAMMV